MAISAARKLTLSANGTYDWVRLPLGIANTLNIDCPTWAGSSVAVEYSKDATEAGKKPLPSPVDGSAYSATANAVVGVDAAGYVRPVVSSYGGTPIEFSVDA